MEPYQIALIALLVALAAFGVLYGRRAQGRAKRLYAEQGRDVVGWVVQANDRLSRPGRDDLPAVVVYTFDTGPDVPQLLARVAARCGQLRAREPNTPAEREVAGWVRDDYFPGLRKVPPELAEGRDVFYYQVVVLRRHLPNGVLDRPFVNLRAVPGENPLVPYMRPYGRTDRDADEDADDLVSRIQ